MTKHTGHFSIVFCGSFSSDISFLVNKKLFLTEKVLVVSWVDS